MWIQKSAEVKERENNERGRPRELETYTDREHRRKAARNDKVIPNNLNGYRIKRKRNRYRKIWSDKLEYKQR